MLLRRVIGDALRARRQAQHRTLREVSGAANVSLGYLSEIERGQKEASSELLASICDALGAHLSEVFREVSDTFALAEQVTEAMTPAEHQPSGATGELVTVPAPTGSIEELVDGRGGTVTVTVRHDAPLKTTLRTVRNIRTVGGGRERDVVYTG